MNDHESTTVKIKRLDPRLGWLLPYRHYLTPSALWAAIGALVIAVGYVLNAQHDIHRHQESIANLQLEFTQERDLLQTMNTQLAVMSAQMNDISIEMDRQRAWRERIEVVAEEPHARRKR